MATEKDGGHESGKEAVVSRSFSLDRENIEWLERVNESSDRKSVSNTLNFILTNLRTRKNIGMDYGK